MSRRKIAWTEKCPDEQMRDENIPLRKMRDEKLRDENMHETKKCRTKNGHGILINESFALKPSHLSATKLSNILKGVCV